MNEVEHINRRTDQTNQQRKYIQLMMHKFDKTNGQRRKYRQEGCEILLLGLSADPLKNLEKDI